MSKFNQNFLAFALFLGIVAFTKVNAQSTYFAAGITPERLRAHLEVLTSDSLAGRETGTIGNLKATRYIADHFEALKLPTLTNHTYYQNIAFTNETFATSKVRIYDKDYSPSWDFYAFPAYNGDMQINTNEVVFLGYGIDDKAYSDYKGMRRKLKGKVIMIYDNEPTYNDSISWLTHTAQLSVWSTDFTKKITTAKKYGVKAILVIDGNLQKNLNKFRNSYIYGSFKAGYGNFPEKKYTNCVYISTTMASQLIGSHLDTIIKTRDYIRTTGKNKSVKFKTQIEIAQQKSIKQLLGRNVLGYIEGTHPALRNEVVIVTAHLDHLGVKGESIYRGADDDGSGTSAVLEIARAFAEAKQKGQGPKRSVLCLLVTGEEKGLLGSDYYTTYPAFPLVNTVADVNIDMVGRIDEAHANNPNYIYVIGADKLSQELHDINEMVNAEHTQLVLDYKYNDENEPNRYYYRSDHYNFAKNGIPAIFYFNGTHADYHRPSDTIEKINFEVLSKRAKLAFYTAWEIANRDERLKLNEK